MRDTTSFADEKPPERVTLPITVHPQETDLWCWAATGQMTMEFLGKTVSQSEQANRVFQRSDCDDRPVPKPCVRGGFVTLEPYGFSAEISKKPLSEQQIVELLSKQRTPIPFGRRWPGGGGHIGLIVGYLRTNDGRLLVEVVDPFPPAGKNKTNREGGQRTLMPYRRWAGNDAESAFDHALFNLTKKAAEKKRS